MIDIYRFLNSKDVAGYLRNTHFTFTAQQAAYFVDISTHVTLSEKIRAWRSIVGEMPDEQIPAGKGKHDSAHELISAHIADKEKKLKLFMNNEALRIFPTKAAGQSLPLGCQKPGMKNMGSGTRSLCRYRSQASISAWLT